MTQRYGVIKVWNDVRANAALFDHDRNVIKPYAYGRKVTKLKPETNEMFWNNPIWCDEMKIVMTQLKQTLKALQNICNDPQLLCFAVQSDIAFMSPQWP